MLISSGAHLAVSAAQASICFWHWNLGHSLGRLCVEQERLVTVVIARIMAVGSCLAAHDEGKR